MSCKKLILMILEPEHFMVCSEDDTVLKVDARRALNSATEIHFAYTLNVHNIASIIIGTVV